MRHLRFALPFAALLLLVAPLAAQDEEPTAPDGRPGLGATATAHELGRLVSSSKSAASELVHELADLQSDLLVLHEMARRHYLKRGDFAPLTEEAELAELHALWGELEPNANVVLFAGDERATLARRLLLDLRFQLRVVPTELAVRESIELRKGLALLRGSQDGAYDLKDSEARTVAARIDLASAILRAARSDLHLLRERGDAGAPGAPDPAWEAELERLATLPNGVERADGLAALRALVDQRRAQMESLLFWPRLEPKVVTLLDKRRAFVGVASQRLEGALRFLMVPPYDVDPSPSIADLSRSERHHYALSEALRGVDADPLNEELAYWAGVAAAEVIDPRESRAWFDRYLALRGIRVDKQDTLRRRELTPHEEHAVEQVLQAFTGPR